MIQPDDEVYLDHILELECATLIQSYTRNGRDEFMQNALINDRSS